MIKYIQGNIFDSKCDAIVNPVNCRSTMGKGLALSFKAKYPKMFHEYQNACRDGIIKIGKVYLHVVSKDNPKFVFSFPTKDHWKDPSKIEYIASGLKSLVEYIEWSKDNINIESIAIPLLGAGLGGLNENLIIDLITSTFEDLDYTVELYISRK